MARSGTSAAPVTRRSLGYLGSRLEFGAPAVLIGPTGHADPSEPIRIGWSLAVDIGMRSCSASRSSTNGTTIRNVTVVKRSVSIDAEVAAAAEEAAAEDGVSFSAWLSEAAHRQLLVRKGLRGVAEWERSAGALTPDELAAGEVLLDRLLSGGSRKRTRSA